MTIIDSFPRRRKRRVPTHRRFHVRYDLAYDGGGDTWTGYYHTPLIARLAIFYNMRIASYGGKAVLVDTRPRGV